MVYCMFKYYSNKIVKQEGGCSSVVERMLCMYEAPGSIPGISRNIFIIFIVLKALLNTVIVSTSDQKINIFEKITAVNKFKHVSCRST